MNFFSSKKTTDLAAFAYEWSRNTRLSESTSRRYRLVGRLIQGFGAAKGVRIMTDSFNDNLAEEYVHYILSLKPQKGRTAYLLSTVRAMVDKTVSLLRKAQREGYEVCLSGFDNIRIKGEDSCTVYLSLAELSRLNALKLDRGQSQVRDIFLIGCFTALRYSDYSRLSEEHFSHDIISIKTKKTGVRVEIPIHPVVRGIIERNKGYDFLRYDKSQQNFNVRLKTICQKAGFTGNVLIERTEGYDVVRKLVPKYQLITSHTARRSGATNMYLAGIPPFRIMLITGHTTETSFYRYIRIQKEENAISLLQHPFFRQQVE